MPEECSGMMKNQIKQGGSQGEDDATLRSFDVSFSTRAPIPASQSLELCILGSIK